MRWTRARGATSFALRARLAARAFAHTASYDSLVADYLAREHGATTDPFPAQLGIGLARIATLRYGEEPASARRVLSQPGRTCRQHRRRALRAGQGTVLQQHRRCRTPHWNACGSSSVKHASSSSMPIPAVSPWRRRCTMPMSSLTALIPTSAFGGHHCFQPSPGCRTAKLILDRQFVEVAGGASAARWRGRGCWPPSRMSASCSRRAAAGHGGRGANCAALAAAVLVQDRDAGRIDAGTLTCVTARSQPKRNVVTWRLRGGSASSSSPMPSCLHAMRPPLALAPDR